MRRENEIAKEVAEIISFLEDKCVKRYWFQIDGSLGISYIDIYDFRFGLNSRIRVQDSVPLETSSESTLDLVKKLYELGLLSIDDKFIKNMRGDD